LSLRRTTILSIFVTFLLLSVVLAISLQMVFSRHFQYEESQQNVLNMQRVQSGFENQFTILNYLADEWSSQASIWDLPVGDVENFAQLQLMEESFTEQGIDVWLLLDQELTIWSTGGDASRSMDAESSISVFESLQGESGLLEFNDEVDRKHGILIVDQTPWLISAASIPMAENELSGGLLLVGRRFDESDIQSLAEQVKFPIRVGLFNGSGDDPDFQLARLHFQTSEETTYLETLSETNLAGYVLIEDINQEPALILRADQYRFVARNATLVMRYMILALVSATLVFAAFFFGLIERTMLSRLLRLDREVQVIAGNPLESRRVTVDRKDEIASVSGNINQMLDSLERSQQERFALQQQIVGIVESVEDIIFTIDVDLNHLQFFGTQAQQLGLHETDLSDQEKIPIYLKESWPIHREAAQRVIEGEHLIYESSTRFEADTFIYQISMSPLRDKTGKITGIVGVGRDISQTKHMERALQGRYEEMRVLLEISQLFLKQKNMAETQTSICELVGNHFDATLCWLGERNQEGKILPIAVYGAELAEINPVTIYEHLLHNYSLKPVFVISSLDLYGRFEEDIFYALIIPLNWGQAAQVLYLFFPKMPLLDEQKKQFAESLGSLCELVLTNTRLLNEVKTSQENLQELSHQLVRVHEEERRNLARELHDEIGQYLTALKLRLNQENGGKTINMEQVEQAQELVNELIRKVRKMSLDLRPSMLDDLGLQPALDWYFERYTQQTGIVVDFDPQELEQKRFSSEVEITIFRIVQESLTNVARHAGVEKVYVQVVAFQDTLELMIDDEGIGFALEEHKAGSSSGLTGMAERTRLLQGEMEIQTMPGKGTRILVRLPLRQEETS
jgi:PAS domain S-box-containing protein